MFDMALLEKSPFGTPAIKALPCQECRNAKSIILYYYIKCIGLHYVFTESTTQLSTEDTTVTETTTVSQQPTRRPCRPRRTTPRSAVKTNDAAQPPGQHNLHTLLFIVFIVSEFYLL